MNASRADYLNARKYATEFLLQYRVTYHATTRASPAQLLQHRTPRTQLDMLNLNIQSSVRLRKEKERFIHALMIDRSTLLRGVATVYTQLHWSKEIESWRYLQEG